MSRWHDSSWEPEELSGVPRRDRRFGPYRAYVPDVLEDRALSLGRSLSLRVAEAERSVRALGTGEGADALESISRFLLRSEAIASSRIEGIAPSARQAALAELGESESVRGVSEQARLVANNMTIVRSASQELVDVDHVSVEHVEGLHDALLPADPHHGLRTVQNWIGGSDWHPLNAAFVPPPVDQVRGLMEDLVGYLNGAAHSPIVQAALVHAQFETIHPFTDGNGRVGRALIHTVLTRRGLTPTAILPVSLVLATRSDEYVEGLTEYRYLDDPASDRAQAGVRAWLSMFVNATMMAADQAAQLKITITDLRSEWHRRVAGRRTELGKRAAPRSDSATARLLHLLPQVPVVTASTLQRILGVSFPAANAALDELTDAEVLTTRKIERNTSAYLADEVLDLLTMTERRLASTRFDPTLSPPHRAAPAAPGKRPS